MNNFSLFLLGYNYNTVGGPGRQSNSTFPVTLHLSVSAGTLQRQEASNNPFPSCTLCTAASILSLDQSLRFWDIEKSTTDWNFLYAATKCNPSTKLLKTAVADLQIPACVVEFIFVYSCGARRREATDSALAVLIVPLLESLGGFCSELCECLIKPPFSWYPPSYH